MNKQLSKQLNTRLNKGLNRWHAQRGATLIIVLVLLVLMAIIGTVATRSSILSLKIATNSQIQALLMENSDAVLFNIEDPQALNRQLAQDGMFSYFNSAEHSENELVFCYRADADAFFKISHASAIRPNGTIDPKKGLNGFCKNNDFSSGRSAVLSQVYLKKILLESAPLTQVVKGMSLGQATLPIVSHHVNVTVISILPSFSDISSTQIEQCFQKTAAEVSQCFNQYNVPYNTQHAQYVVGGQPKLVS
ncbi:hypothetical protein EC844_101236 [Acinetobacter calcoaceticus]|uniref:Type 4 fimbrial biogenesis protein PilX N-terminal domain-containing protein n=1 Tax=Acinetobacter calcoaceticus TaxID=471 RepID=A0A4R1Y5H1_ACICA|nr:hypothetical protein EC844_101236 [Acinetobacter calcoaceticus]